MRRKDRQRSEEFAWAVTDSMRLGGIIVCSAGRNALQRSSFHSERGRPRVLSLCRRGEEDRGAAEQSEGLPLLRGRY